MAGVHSDIRTFAAPPRGPGKFVTHPQTPSKSDLLDGKAEQRLLSFRT